MKAICDTSSIIKLQRGGALDCLGQLFEAVLIPPALQAECRKPKTRAEGQTEAYLTMLARLGQVDVAMKAAETHMQSQGEAFALAQALREQGALAQALDIARRGSNLTGQDYLQHKLAIWTSELAEGLEGLIDKTIKAVRNLGYYHSELVHRVMDAAVAEHPDWVIDNACRRAEEIIDAGRANAYHHAVDWLRKARAAYLASQRQSQWSTYRTKLMATHGRKYKLMSLLRHRDLD